MSYAMTQDLRADVAAADRDRERVLDAMVRLAGTRAWHSLSVDVIRVEANVTKEAFEQRFVTVDACFVAAAEDALERLCSAVLERADDAEASWPGRICSLVAGFLGFLVSDRARAWIAVVEPLGGRARVARKRAVQRLIELAGEAPVDTRGEDRVIATTLEPQIAALWELGRQFLADPEALPLEDVARSQIFRMLSPYLPREEAMRYAFTTAIDVPARYATVGVGATDGQSSGR